MPHIERLDAVTIYTPTPEALAAWYGHFGWQQTGAFPGGVLGTFGSSSNALTVALIRPRAGVPVQGRGAVVLTFQVTELPEFLAALAAQQIVPIETQQNANGHFALFQDPEGNHLELWSD